MSIMVGYSLTAGRNSKKSSGFTIVELLIVIVIIGILAAITIVAYNGVTASAEDAGVKSDLENFSKQVLMTNASANTMDQTTLVDSYGLHQKMDFSAYATTVTQNFIWCVGKDSGSHDTFALIAMSKSNRAFADVSGSGVVPWNGTWTSDHTGTGAWNMCLTLLPTMTSVWTGYDSNNTQSPQWYSWTGGPN